MQILEKIKTDIAERSISKQIAPFGNSGSSRVEYGYSYHRSKLEPLKDYFFVVSKFIDYKGNSISDFGKEVYIYDKEGNFLENPDLKKMCRGGFFNSLTDF